jgi:L-Ala-D/L-Glu epimerase
MIDESGLLPGLIINHHFAIINMKITKIEQFPYAIPFAAQFATARGELKKRRGIILQVHTDEGLVGLGDVAPLPEFNGNTIELVSSYLNRFPTLYEDVEVEKPASKTMLWNAWLYLHKKNILRNEVKSFLDNKFLADVDFGWETAIYDLLSQNEGIPLVALLNNQNIYNPEIKVNATIGLTDKNEAAEAARNAVVQGFGCVKVKVGVATSFDEEIERVAAIRDAIGKNTKLRLDANGAWSVPQAIGILHTLSQYDIELVEQPVPAQNIEGLKEVRRKGRVPIAADEAVANLVDADRVISERAADILVLKPVMLGGMEITSYITRKAQENGLQSFVTTALESGVGIAATLHLAAALPEPRLHCGLATASLLEDSLVENLPPVVNGTMTVPPAPGLGVRLNYDALEKYRDTSFKPLR